MNYVLRTTDLYSLFVLNIQLNFDYPSPNQPSLRLTVKLRGFGFEKIIVIFKTILDNRVEKSTVLICTVMNSIIRLGRGTVPDG